MESPAVQKNKTECKMAIRNEEPHVNKRFPRARGDVPHYIASRDEAPEFSPRTRGCSQQPYVRSNGAQVFPAHAGMFRSSMTSVRNEICFPRARGDVPIPPSQPNKPPAFSPRTRGCSAHFSQLRTLLFVFPAHAGMFRCKTEKQFFPYSFPRARGDVPVYRWSKPFSV